MSTPQLASLHQRLKRTLKRSKMLVHGFRRTEAGLRTLLYHLSPEWLAKVNFRHEHGRWPNLEDPVTFDEKLLWLMLFWRHPLKSKCADKFAVRAFVEECGLAHTLPKFLGVYERAADIDFSALPSKFVLKCTHGCAMNVICRSKDALDLAATRRQLDMWLKVDLSKMFGEVHYAAVPPRIVAEDLLENELGGLPNDFKLYCFGGRVHCTMVCSERETGYPRFEFYDRDWVATLPYSTSNSHVTAAALKPTAYQNMLLAAETLASPFPFVRVDFYDVGGRAVFGELTFTPHACADSGYTDLAQKELGELVILPSPLLV